MNEEGLRIPPEEFYWQPTIWTAVTTCRKCGNPCKATIKWMRKRECLECPNGWSSGRP